MCHRLLLCCVLGCGAAACSHEDPPPSETECERSCPSTSGVDLSAPAVTFSADVVPIFAKSCNDQLCHGNALGARAGLYLGPAANASVTEIASVYGALTRPSKTAPSVAIISPGSPAQSFLMHKVDGCQNSLGLTCDAEPNLCRADCGDPMPPLPRDTYAELSSDDKLTLRRWIAQGAPL